MVTNRTFKTFQKREHKKLSINNLLILVGVLVFFIGVLVYTFQPKEMLASLYKASGLLFLLIFCYIVFKSYNQQENLRGEVSGTLELLSTKILVNGRVIKLTDMEKLSIQIQDFEGKRDDLLIASPTSSISNGYNNLLTIRLLSNDEIQINFAQQYENQFKRINKEVLTDYYKAGVLSFNNLLEILQLDDYDKIQEFKKTIG